MDESTCLHMSDKIKYIFANLSMSVSIPEYYGNQWTLIVVARTVLGIVELMNISIKQIEIDFIDSQTWSSLIAEAFYRRFNAKYIVEAPELVWRQSFLRFSKVGTASK